MQKSSRGGISAWSLPGVFLMLLVLSSPALADSWECIGPEGGSFVGAVTDPTNADTVIAVTSYPSACQVFRTDNGGASWAKISEIPETSLYDMCGFDISTLYVNSYQGCYSSKDAGVTWTYTAWPTGAGYAYSMCTHPTDPNKVYAGGYLYSGTYDAIFFDSPDGGITWRSKSTGVSMITYGIAVAKSDPNVIYMAGYQISGSLYGMGVAQSLDGGTTWRDISSAVDTDQYQYGFSVAIDPTNEDNVYVGGYRFYRSTDGGATWTKNTANSYYINSIGVDPATPANVYLGDNACVYMSGDYGQTLTKHSGCIAGYVEHMEVAPALCSSVYAAATYGGLFKSEDYGATWNPGHTGIYAASIPSMAVAPSQPETVFMDLYAASSLLATYDSGDNWTAVTYPNGCSGTIEELMVSSIDPDNVIALEAG